MPSSTEIDDIVEEIINNLRPLRCTLSTATRDIAKIIERGPSQTLSIQQGCVEDALELIITLSLASRVPLPIRIYGLLQVSFLICTAGYPSVLNALVHRR
jgi:hypothetical protein